MRKPVMIAAAAVIAIGVFTVINAKPSDKKDTDATGSKNPAQTSETVAGNISGSTETIDKALNSGGGFACTFENKSGGTSGKIFVSDKKFRVDWKSTIETHMIYDGTWYYIWGGKSISLKLRENKKTFAEAVKAAIDMKTSSNLICFPWVIDEKIFEQPGEKNFPDASEVKQESATSSAR